MTPAKKRLVVLISGRGSNMESLLSACQQNKIHGDVVAVVSNKASAAGLQTARNAGIATAIVDHTAYCSREEFDRELRAVVSGFQPDLVILAGFMRILTGEFVRPFVGRLLNIHPSLLPKYPGLHTHQRAIEAGDREAGATVHFVTEELDGGPAIVQARIPIHEGDDPATLAARVLADEHKIYTEAIRLICDDRIVYAENTGVLLDGALLPEQGIVFGEQSA